MTSLNERKTTLEADIKILDDKIARVESANPTADQIAVAQEYVDKALVNAIEIYNVVNAHTTELFNSNAYKNSYMESIQTQETESMSSSIKLILIGAASGFVLGLLVWGVDGLVLEIRNVRKQNELKEEKKNEK